MTMNLLGLTALLLIVATILLVITWWVRRKRKTTAKEPIHNQTTDELTELLTQSEGMVLGDYRVLEKIGAGGMGIVFKAEHCRMKRVVAVKILPTNLESGDDVRRFYQEVEAAAKLQHPNIVMAHDAGEHNGMHYLVMEFVEGEDLARVVGENGPMSVTDAVECVVQAARGLEYTQ